LVRLLDRLEAAIAAQPAETRDDFRIAQIKEKFARLTVYLASASTPAMTAAIDEASETSLVTCEACGAPAAWPNAGYFGRSSAPLTRAGPRWTRSSSATRSRS
jgi:hypothetical protein